MSRFHFHRVFKAHTGHHAQGLCRRAPRRAPASSGLAQAASVTAAAYDAGFNSSGRFYAASPGVLGMTPTRYRAGGGGETIRFAVAAVLAGRAAGGRDRQGHLLRSCSATTRRRWCATCRTASRRPS